MCGICGFIHNKRVKEDILYIMNDTLNHRGPDDSGVYTNISKNGYQVGLGHRRLSILDLSEMGHQPMISADGQVIVVFNGEIYNFSDVREELQLLGDDFISTCDTEVIMKAFIHWGIECVNKFNGMFAIAIYDKREEVLYLVRDRIGVKPLFYYYENGNIAFASELKALYKYPFFKKEINPAALSEYLCRGSISGEKCIFNSTYKLLPGAVLCWKNGHISINSYWSITERFKNINKFSGSYNDAIDFFHSLLTDAVSKRLVSDVPIGCFLSGGYDSALISAVMQELSKNPIKTFTIGFDEPGYDESKYAREVADILKTDHTCTILSLEEGKKYVEQLSYYYDEPMSDSSAIATMLLSKTTRDQVTVALSGDAGDELFCGYNLYGDLKRYSKWIPVSRFLNIFKRLRPNVFRSNRKLNKLSQMTSWDNVILAESLNWWELHESIMEKAEFLDRAKKLLRLSDIPEKKFMLMDLGIYLPDDIMVKVDRASMAFSLETRSPFLDFRIVEFSLSLPIEYCYHNGIKKRILKDLAYRYIPKNVLERPKTGFGVPVLEWLRRNYKEMTKNYLDEDFIKKQGLFNYDEVLKIINAFKKGNDPVAIKDIWTMLNFQMWWEAWMC